MYATVDTCEGCGSADLKQVLSLGSSPPTCNMVKVGKPRVETFYPLDLLECQVCSLVQLSVIVDPAEVFPPDLPYSSGNSAELHRNFEDLAASVEVVPDDLVVDIGANDGTLLSKFDCRTFGVEPTNQAQKIEGDWWQVPFSAEIAEAIRDAIGPAKVITACNVLAHVEDINDVLRGVDILLADDGVLVAENHNLASVVKGQWDAVYHEHLRYYSPSSFARTLEANGFTPKIFETIPTHGGSFRAFVYRGKPVVSIPSPTYDWDALAQRIRMARWCNREKAIDLAGIGATARSTTILNYCGLDVDDVAYIAEVPGSDKIGHYVPGTSIPIVDEAQLLEDDRDAFLFSWHLRRHIVPKLRERGYKGEIYGAL
jgi:2-polyprenyl-3-methyl-5-hydroxy-6-metoxy-1,4-benzoquinol methylase